MSAVTTQIITIFIYDTGKCSFDYQNVKRIKETTKFTLMFEFMIPINFSVSPSGQKLFKCSSKISYHHQLQIIITKLLH